MLLPTGNDSTSIFQPVSSTSTIASFLNSVHHGNETTIRLAEKNGRVPGAFASMTKSSSANLPGVMSAWIRPMWTGTSKYLLASRSARFLSAGKRPRSIEKNETTTAARTAMTMANRRRVQRQSARRRVPRGAGSCSATGSAACGASLTGSVYDDQEATRFHELAFGDRDFFHVTVPRRR